MILKDFFEYRIRLQCGFCTEDDEVGHPPEYATPAFERLGWDMIGRLPACPKCMANHIRSQEKNYGE